MSSRTVEREIVQMEFDARKFSTGVASATKDLGSFKKQFDMSQQQRGLKELEKTADGIQFQGMQSGIQQVSASFSAMQVVAFTVINRITNAALDMGKKLVSAITIDPVKTGLEEYETQLNAVQTIMANTAKHGTTLEDVNGALDELNEYADLTIYNFTEMTSAIGRFTTAGIELDTSVQAIKGLSNVAALSGANAQEAARGQYQLSQALSSGMIRLQDWMSIENANMGGQVFRDSLIETAKVHGVNVDKMIEKHGSFRLSLQEQWLSSEIMLETLSKFTGELSDADLLALGYNEEQIAAIQQTAELALDAATKIKTVTQLIDVVKEALQSGWAQSWRTIIGDFEEAKEFWGKIGDIIAIPIERSAAERNKQLSFWADTGGRQKVVDALIMTLWSGLRILTAFQEVINEVFGSIKAGDLLVFSDRVLELAKNFADVTQRLGGFKDTLRGVFGGVKSIIEGVVNIIKALAGGITDVFEPIQGSQIVKMAEGFKNLADQFKAGTENLEPLRKIVSGVAAALDIVLRFVVALIGPLSKLNLGIGEGRGAFIDWLVSIADMIVAWREMAIETDLFNTAAQKVADYIQKIVDEIHKAIDAFMDLEVVKDVRDWLNSLTKEDFVAAWKSFLDVLKAIATPIVAIGVGIKYLITELGKVDKVAEVGGKIKAISWQDIKDGIRDASDSIKEFFNSLKESEILIKVNELLATIKQNLFTEPFDKAKESINGLSESFSGLTEKIGSANKETEETAGKFDELEPKIKEFADKALLTLQDMANDINWDSVIKLITVGFLGSLANTVKNIAHGGLFKDIGENLFGEGTLKGLSKGLIGSLEGVQGVLTSYQTNVKADTLQKIAVAIAIFAGAILIMTLIDPTKLALAGAAIAGLLTALFGSASVMNQVSTKDLTKMAVAMIAISAAILIVSFALNAMSGIDPERIEQSLVAMAAGIIALVAALRGLGGKGSAQDVIVLIGLAGALNILAIAIEKFGAMDSDQLMQGLAAASASVMLLVSSVVILAKYGDKGITKAASAVGIMAYALGILVNAVKKFGDMDQDILVQGLISTGAVLAAFALFSRIVKGPGMIQAAVGILIMSAALVILTQSIQAIGGMNQDQLIQGLIGIGAALLILAVAGALMSGAIGGAIAMIIMSVALLAIAGALKVLSTLSLEELGIALLAIAGVFLVLGLSALILTPLVPILLALGAAMFLIGIGAALLGAGVFLAATGLVALAASGAAVAGVIGLIGLAIVEIIPKIATALAEGITNFIVTIGEKAPELKEAFKSIVLSMITGFTELIPEIVIAVFTMVDEILAAIVERLPDIIQSGYDILLSFIEGLENNIADIVTAGLGVLTEFINGLKEGIPDLVNSAFELLLEWLTAIDNAVIEYTPQIVEKGLAIAGHLIEGMAQGIAAGAGTIKQAVLNLAYAALDALGLGFLMDSPSRATYYIGTMATAGLYNALIDGQKPVREGMRELVDATLDELNPLERAILDVVENEWEFSPAITPVMDLTNISQGTNLANSLFRDIQFAPNTGPSVEVDADVVGRSQSSGENVTYVQHIHSPKALDNATIYRQTRTLVATRSRRAFET